MSDVQEPGSSETAFDIAQSLTDKLPGSELVYKAALAIDKAVIAQKSAKQQLMSRSPEDGGGTFTPQELFEKVAQGLPVEQISTLILGARMPEGTTYLRNDETEVLDYNYNLVLPGFRSFAGDLKDEGVEALLVQSVGAEFMRLSRRAQSGEVIARNQELLGIMKRLVKVPQPTGSNIPLQ